MIRIREVKVSILEDRESVLLERIAKKVSLPASSILDYQIVKKSLDARDKNHILWIYEVDVSLLNEEKVLKKHPDLMVAPKE